jgi:hypothetical protein
VAWKASRNPAAVAPHPNLGEAENEIGRIRGVTSAWPSDVVAAGDDGDIADDSLLYLGEGDRGSACRPSSRIGEPSLALKEVTEDVGVGVGRR